MLELLEKSKENNFSISYVSNIENELKVNTFFRLRENAIIKFLKDRSLISKNDSPQEVFLALRKLRNEW